jgi:hypothetical protein
LRLLLLARAAGLHCIAVTDHNRIDGALRCVELAAGDPSLPRVIPGVEVTCAQGEVIGLFVRDPIPRGRDVEETIELIRSREGVVYLPHPFDTMRRATVRPQDVERVGGCVDVIEVANGRSLIPGANGRALALAARLGKRLGAGSDAHFAGEVGRCFLELSDEAVSHGRLDLCSRDEFLRALAHARPQGMHPLRGVSTAWAFALGTGLLKAGRRTRNRLRSGSQGT